MPRDDIGMMMSLLLLLAAGTLPHPTQSRVPDLTWPFRPIVPQVRPKNAWWQQPSGRSCATQVRSPAPLLGHLTTRELTPTPLYLTQSGTAPQTRAEEAGSYWRVSNDKVSTSPLQDRACSAVPGLVSLITSHTTWPQLHQRNAPITDPCKGSPPGHPTARPQGTSH